MAKVVKYKKAKFEVGDRKLFGDIRVQLNELKKENTDSRIVELYVRSNGSPDPTEDPANYARLLEEKEEYAFMDKITTEYMRTSGDKEIQEIADYLAQESLSLVHYDKKSRRYNMDRRASKMGHILLDTAKKYIVTTGPQTNQYWKYEHKNGVPTGVPRARYTQATGSVRNLVEDGDLLDALTVRVARTMKSGKNAGLVEEIR